MSDGYIIEFHQCGKQVKVTAIDPVSLREVSTIASPSISRQDMIQLAVRKLEYVLNKS